MSEVISEIPLFDLNKLGGQTQWKPKQNKLWKEVADSFAGALSRIGFIYLIGHGIPNQKIKSAFEFSEQFFELPNNVKEKYTKENASTDMHGYSGPGQEKLAQDSNDDLRECYDFAYWKNDKLPVEVHHFTQANKVLKEECKILTKTLLQLIALSLDLSDVDHFIKCHTGLSDQEESNNSFSKNLYRSQFYPAIMQNETCPELLRCPEHSDFGTITLLFQDVRGGLQVKNDHQQWINVNPIPNSVLVNTGDLLEIWSSGKFKATPHRVIIQNGSNGTPKRQSIAFFVNPDDSTIVQPLSNRTSTKDYKPTTPGEHYAMKIKESYS